MSQDKAAPSVFKPSVADSDAASTKVPAAFAGPPADEEADVKVIRLTVPQHIPDKVIQNAVQLGMMVVGRLAAEMAVIVFPAFRKQEDGTLRPVMGKVDVQLLDLTKDLEPLLEVARVLNKKNEDILATQNNPTDALTAQVSGNRMVTEVVRQAKSAITGEAGIIRAFGG